MSSNAAPSPTDPARKNPPGILLVAGGLVLIAGVMLGVVLSRTGTPRAVVATAPEPATAPFERQGIPPSAFSPITISREDHPTRATWKRDPATWTARPEDVPERYRPQQWTKAVQKLDERLKNAAGAKGKATYTDCSEMPCISYFEIEGFDVATPKEPLLNEFGKPNPKRAEEETKIQREVVEKASKYFDEVQRDTLGDYGRGAMPFVEVVSPAPGKTQIAVSFMPVENDATENGVAVKGDSEVQSRLQKRMAVHWQ